MEDHAGRRALMARVEEELGPLGGEGEGGGHPPVVIRPATLEDVTGVAAIEKLSFPNPWQPDTFRSLMAQKRAHILVAEAGEGEEILGYAVVWWVMEQGELANLAVVPAHQGRGLGSALLDRVLSDVREQGVESLSLEVRVSNVGARALYLSRGFTQVALRKDYYRNPREDALILLRRVDSGMGEDG